MSAWDTVTNIGNRCAWKVGVFLANHPRIKVGVEPPSFFDAIVPPSFQYGSVKVVGSTRDSASSDATKARQQHMQGISERELKLCTETLAVAYDDILVAYRSRWLECHLILKLMQ